MGGICGVISLSKREQTQAFLIDMQFGIQHRGKEPVCIFHEPGIGMLALSHGNKQQQQYSECGRYVMVYDGTIYNACKLQMKYFPSQYGIGETDSFLVVMLLYEKMGCDCFKLLNGQFSIAIYDRVLHSVTCVRDQFGISPLYYTQINSEYMLFASEVKGLLNVPGIVPKLNFTALDQMMTFPGLVSPQTMFRDIYSLKNGHFLQFSNFSNNEQEMFWDIIYPKQDEASYQSDEYYLEMFAHLLKDAIRVRYNENTGFYLSGGLDSSIIAAMANVLTDQPICTFSIDFNDSRYSERKHQEIMVQHLNSEHKRLNFDVEDIMHLLARTVRLSETPLKETYNTASLFLSNCVAQCSVNSILSGEGADELFAGYVGYKFDKMRNETNISLSERVYRTKIYGDASFVYENSFENILQANQKIYSKQFLQYFEEYNCLNGTIIETKRLQNVDVIHKRSYLDYIFRLPEHLLAGHGDRMMAVNGISGRYPFLDKDLVELAVSMPPHLKLNGFVEKYIIKKHSRDFLPDSVINRPKYSFVAPGSPQLLQLKNEYIWDLLSYNQISSQGIFNPEYIEQLKLMYSEPGFYLNLPFERDMLILPITLGIFLQEFNISNL